MKETKKMVSAAMFLALGLLLPFVTGNIPAIGKMLCPMHIPVLLCGLVCGWQYGAAVGFITPLMRSVMFQMPVFFPTAWTMAFELAAYGLVIGLLFSRFRRQNIVTLYASLITAMIVGRVVMGVVSVPIYAMGPTAYTWSMFIGGALLTAYPGIIVQLILIPAIMIILDKTGVLPFAKNEM